MGRPKKTTDQFKQEVYEQVGDEYTVLGEYKNSGTKILMRHNCDKCNNHEYLTTPENFLGTKNRQGRRCPKCKYATISDNMKMNTEWFKNEVFNQRGSEYTVLGEYTKGDNKILMRHNCDKCNNHEWLVRPHDFLHKQTKCPECYGNKLKNTNTFNDEIINITNGEYLVIGKYINNKTKIKFQHNCEDCNNFIFEMRPDNFINGQRCPKCNELKKSSYGELFISEYLDNINIYFEKQVSFNDCRDINVLPFDFKFNNILLEFDGLQHWTGWMGNKDDYTRQHKHDLIKTAYCIKSNLTLIRIPYTEQHNLTNILDSLINNDVNDLKNCLVIKEGKIYQLPEKYKEMINIES